MGHTQSGFVATYAIASFKSIHASSSFLYVSSVSYQLTYKVVEALVSLGLPFRDDLSGEVHDGKKYRYDNLYQIIMFGDELYEYSDDDARGITGLHA